jgi:hypothetical protein
MTPDMSVMGLYSYIVARDFGFAPNPFFGTCTLATCKPDIRRKAHVGDWILGTGSKRNGIAGRVVYAMQVSEVLSYDQYWNDARFREKRPYLGGSWKQAYGDNIYHRDRLTGKWLQADSHHSLRDGSPNAANIFRDTRSENVLIGEVFYYFGGSGPLIPRRFRDWNGDGIDICKGGPSHKCHFPQMLVSAFIDWIGRSRQTGYIADPAQFQ